MGEGADHDDHGLLRRLHGRTWPASAEDRFYANDGLTAYSDGSVICCGRRTFRLFTGANATCFASPGAAVVRVTGFGLGADLVTRRGHSIVARPISQPATTGEGPELFRSFYTQLATFCTGEYGTDLSGALGTMSCEIRSSSPVVFSSLIRTPSTRDDDNRAAAAVIEQPWRKELYPNDPFG